MNLIDFQISEMQKILLLICESRAFIVVGSELLIGFPDYTVYFAFVANGFALLFEIILVVYQIKEFCLKKKQDKKEKAEL